MTKTARPRLAALPVVEVVSSRAPTYHACYLVNYGLPGRGLCVSEWYGDQESARLAGWFTQWPVVEVGPGGPWRVDVMVVDRAAGVARVERLRGAGVRVVGERGRDDEGGRD